MDPIAHISQKILAERARQASHRQPSEAPPPPYTPSDSGEDSDDDDNDAEEGPSSPLKLTINAAHSIQGSNNLVPTSPSALADATRFSTILLHSIKQINNAASAKAGGQNINVDLTINCGITIVGDRNVIGNVGLKPKPLGHAVAGPDAFFEGASVVGAKRKAEDSSDAEPEAKRAAVDDAQSA